jgi:hypothetical protein
MMKHYLLKTNKEELTIMGVNPEDEIAFHAAYGNEIIFSEENIQELLIRWHQLLKEAPAE